MNSTFNLSSCYAHNFKTVKKLTNSEKDLSEFYSRHKIFYCKPFKTKRGGSTLFRADFHGREWQ